MCLTCRLVKCTILRYYFYIIEGGGDLSEIAVVTDSNSGITQSEGEELGVFVLPMPFDIDGKEYFEDINLTQEQFYEKLKNGADVSTSQPSPESVTGLWNKVLKDYDSLIYIPMSGGLSGSVLTAQMLSERYNGRVQVVNNHRISVTQRQSVLDAQKLIRETDLSAEEIRRRLEKHGPDSSIYIMVDTLKYLKKGGRITPVAAALGGLLKIKPVLQIQGEKLDAFAKARTLKQAKSIMLEAIHRDIDNRFKDGPEGRNIDISVSYTPGPGIDGWVKEAKAEFPHHDIYHAPLSLSISCHVGPGALAITATTKIRI